MEMNDNHVEFHTVKEFMTFCVGGPDAPGAGTWTSTFPGKYLEGGKEAGGQLVDQRLLPRIDEGEVRILMAGDTCQMAIHKKPMGGGLSAVGGNSEYTYFKPTDPKYKDLVEKLYKDIPTLLPCMDLEGEPLPLLWTCDYIPKNPDDWTTPRPGRPLVTDAETEYVVGEFNCSCVGISKFQAVCGGEQTLADVPDEDYFDACELTDLMGVKAIDTEFAPARSHQTPHTREQLDRFPLMFERMITSALSSISRFDARVGQLARVIVIDVRHVGKRLLATAHGLELRDADARAPKLADGVLGLGIFARAALAHRSQVFGNVVAGPRRARLAGGERIGLMRMSAYSFSTRPLYLASDGV